MGNGAGSQPAGSSPAGIGSPSSAAAPVRIVFPDPRTGVSLTGRALNPKTQDYFVTSDGRMQGQQTVPQLFQLALTTTFNSSSIPGFGQSFSQVLEKGPNYQRQIAAKVANAVAHLTKAKLAVVKQVDVQDVPNNPGAAYILIQWTDLTVANAQTNTTRVGIPSGNVEHLNTV